MKPIESLQFKIQLQSREGKFQGPGSFDGNCLRLGEQAFTVDQIQGFGVADGKLSVQWLDEKNGLLYTEVELYGIEDHQLEQAIVAAQTYRLAAEEKDRLVKIGQVESYEDVVCPFCQATILLVDLPSTPQVFCEYCETLFSRDRKELGDEERSYRICEGCEMYSRPRQFSVFYFYFLIFTFGFHHDSKFRCSACMRNSAWLMVLGNLFGLIALPFALIQLFRSYSEKNQAGMFQGLDDANAMASRKKIELALDKYDEVMDRVPVNAGIKFNVARGLALKKDFEHARQMYEMSLDDCANYWPAIHGLIDCLDELDDVDQLVETRKFWNLD